MIRRKLQSRSGETLAEVLIAMLIVALASMLLVVMITTSGSIDITARNRDTRFYEGLSNAELHEDSTGNGKIVIKKDGVDIADFDVTLYGGSGLTSYEKAASDAEEGGS